jgi:hypothetical protein
MFSLDWTKINLALIKVFRFALGLAQINLGLTLVNSHNLA